MKKPRHKARIKAYIEQNGSITPIIAERLFHCHRLAAVIYRLRKEGMAIKTIDCNEKNVYGEDITYGMYVLDENSNLQSDNSCLHND
jgi:hypothetical protein